MKNQLEKLEERVRSVRNAIFEKVLAAVLNVADFCVTNFKTKTSSEKAKYFRKITENMYREMTAEVNLRRKCTKGEGYDKMDKDSDDADEI